MPEPSGAGWFQSTVNTPRSSSLAFGDGAHGLGEHLADVRARRPAHRPSALPSGILKRCSPRLRKTAFSLLGEGAALLPLQLGDGVVGLVLPLVAEPLEEHQGQDVVLVVLPRGLAAEDVRRAPEVGFKLLEGELHGYVRSART